MVGRQVENAAPPEKIERTPHRFEDRGSNGFFLI
jgi:hypothetical protein